LAEGPEAQAFASQLPAGGKTAVQSVSALSGQLQKAAGKLASQASANLYQAGVNAQAAIVKGLTSDLAGLEKAMEKIATAMIKALKKKLKIKSPSEVFAEIGQQSSEGMAKGLTDSSKLVTDAAETVADDALTAMRDSLKDIQIESLLNTEPVITPVLDLTAIQAGAAQLAGMVPGTVSFGQASAISSAQLAAQNEEAVVAAAGGTSVKFEQNNYSPESLTEIEIYRQTKNQLSQLKTALALT
jgi:soluble cytochrome b562